MVRCNIACRTRFWNMSTIQTCNDIKGRFAHWRLLWRPWSSSCALESGTQEVATIGATCLSPKAPKGHQRLADVVMKSGEQDGIRLFFMGCDVPENTSSAVFGCHVCEQPISVWTVGAGLAPSPGKDGGRADALGFCYPGLVLCSPAKERAAKTSTP